MATVALSGIITPTNVVTATSTTTLTNKTLTGAVVNGTVGATTPSTGAFTSLTASTTLGVTGVATFSAGTAALPAITTTGDTNTGIFFPAADTIAFSEGGVEAARFDSGGNLGLGVTPSAWRSSSKVIQLGGAGVVRGESTVASLSCNNYINSSSQDTYINTGTATSYAQFSGQHVWFNAPSGTAGNAITFTQAMTLDASGNLGVGTTSPSYRLDAIASAGNGSFVSQITNSSTSDGRGILRLRGFNVSQVNTLDFAGGRYFGANDDSLAVINNAAAGGITFNIGGVSNSTQNEAMRIDSNKNLLVGTTSFTSIGTNIRAVNIANSNGGGIVCKNNASSISYAYNDGTNDRFYVTQNTAGVYLANGGTSWTSASDERVKDIIEPITDAANKVSTLRAVIGKYKTDAEGKRRSFLIAQDIQAVLPEAVDASNPDELGVQYTDVIPLLVAAIKEQQALITQLQADVATLKGN